MQKGPDQDKERSRLDKIRLAFDVGKPVETLQPFTDVNVTQAAWAFLDVWFQVEERVSVLRVSPLSHFEQARNDLLVVTPKQAWN